MQDYSVSSDLSGSCTCKQSSSDGMAGSLPLFSGSMSLACSQSLSEKVKTLDSDFFGQHEVSYWYPSDLPLDALLKEVNQPFCRCWTTYKLGANWKVSNQNLLVLDSHWKTALLFDLLCLNVIKAANYARICLDYARIMLAAADYAQIHARLIGTALVLTTAMIIQASLAAHGRLLK